MSVNPANNQIQGTDQLRCQRQHDHRFNNGIANSLGYDAENRLVAVSLQRWLPSITPTTRRTTASGAGRARRTSGQAIVTATLLTCIRRAARSWALYSRPGVNDYDGHGDSVHGFWRHDQRSIFRRPPRLADRWIEFGSRSGPTIPGAKPRAARIRRTPGASPRIGRIRDRAGLREQSLLLQRLRTLHDPGPVHKQRPSERAAKLEPLCVCRGRSGQSP